MSEALITCEWFSADPPTDDDWEGAEKVDGHQIDDFEYETIAAMYIEQGDDEPGDGFHRPIKVWIKHGGRVVRVDVHREAAIDYYGTVKR